MFRSPLTSFSTFSTLSAAVSLVACSSGASGSSGTFNAPPTAGDDSSSGGTVSDVTTDPGDGSDTESATTLASSTTDEPAATSSSTSTGDDLPTGGALLEWSIDANTIDYGSIPVDEAVTTAVVLENVGGSTATSMATGLIAGDYSFPGGYPGTDGDCGTELAPGETCRLDLRFGPTRVGPTQSELVLQYYDGVNTGAPIETETLALVGAGQGESDNLLINGDAEGGSLDPWFGVVNWQLSDQAFGGNASFQPAGAFGVTTLEQEVSVAPWNDETAVAGLRYRVRARARSEGVHPYGISINTQGGNNYVAIANGTETGWTLIEHTAELPLEATDFTVRLECNNGFEAGPCDVLFDDVMLQMVYP